MRGGNAMKWFLLGGAAICAAGPAYAQDVTFKPILEARTRLEIVDQAGLADGATAVTLRVRAGGTITRKRVSALFEGQANVALADDFYDGLHGAATRPLVADPQNIGVSRAQIQYRDKAVAVTVGRQRIALDDERFIGASAFRNNSQSFDAVRVEWTAVPKLKVDISYAWSVRTIWGVDGTGARQPAVSGDNVFANISYATPAGTLTGFAYLVDQDEAAVQGFRLSNQSYGARLAGSRKIGPSAKLNYALSYARQSDYHRNPNTYDASYYLIDGSVELGGFKLGGTYEVLGASSGAALTSFQFPVGTGFRYQGWAGKFGPTPPDGVRDLFGTATYTLPAAGRFKAVTFQASYHRFTSDRLYRPYGSEIDLLGSAKLGRYTLSARYAGYKADGFATDTDKFWLQVDWAF